MTFSMDRGGGACQGSAIEYFGGFARTGCGGAAGKRKRKRKGKRIWMRWECGTETDLLGLRIGTDSHAVGGVARTVAQNVFTI